MNLAYLLTGGNLGDRKLALETAVGLIKEKCGKVLALSSIYATQPWGLENQPEFYNQVVCIATPMEAEALLNQILAIEAAMGRRREVRYGPREIDIDILLFNDSIINTDRLTIPHPEMQNRRFVLAPLVQIAGPFNHPIDGATIFEMLQHCRDLLAVDIVTQ